MEHIDELGSLARPEEALRAIVHDEHAKWEQARRERADANYLFAEMRADALSGQLPLPELSDTEFGGRLLTSVRAALNAFTEKARSEGRDPSRLLGGETQIGLRWIDVLGRKYDVVAANPPYMGSKNMNATVKSYLTAHYPDGKTDLFGAFILRCLDLASQYGRVGLVVPQLWMVLKSFADLRAWVPEPTCNVEGERRGLLVTQTIELLAQLGRHAFTEADPPANVTLLQLAKTLPAATHRMRCFRITAPRESDEQAALLRRGCSSPGIEYSFSPPQSAFLAIPGAPVMFWLRERFLRLLTGPKLEDFATLAEPTTTGDNLRFVAPSGRYAKTAGGGGLREAGVSHAGTG